MLAGDALLRLMNDDPPWNDGERTKDTAIPGEEQMISLKVQTNGNKEMNLRVRREDGST